MSRSTNVSARSSNAVSSQAVSSQAVLPRSDASPPGSARSGPSLQPSISSASSSRPRRISAKRRRANRANAQKSTGPRTAAGKARSRVNASTHNIFSSDIVVQGENAAQFKALRIAMLNEHCPRTITELLLVDRLVQTAWRINRVHAAEHLEHAVANDNARNYKDTIEYKEYNRAQKEMEEYGDDLDDDYDDDEEDEALEDGDDDDLEPAAAKKPPKELTYPEKVPDFDFPGPVTLLSLMQDQPGARRPRIERLHDYEKRLEGTLHRTLKELRILRTPIKGAETPGRHCPFLTQEEHDSIHPAMNSGRDIPTEITPEQESQPAAEQAVVEENAILQNEAIEGGGGHSNEVPSSDETTPPIEIEPSPRPSPGVPGEGVRGIKAVDGQK